MQQQTMQHHWRLVNEVVVSIGTPCFLAGGVAYVAGSVFFLPKFIGEYGEIGAWLFVAGVSGDMRMCLIFVAIAITIFLYQAFGVTQ